MNSSDVYVSESANGYLNKDSKNEKWYKYYLDEYEKLIDKTSGCKKEGKES